MFLLVTTLAFNLVGDGLRDALDPRGQPAAYGRKGRRERRRDRKELERQEQAVSPATATGEAG
jgi:hypothetical protein